MVTKIPLITEILYLEHQTSNMINAFVLLRSTCPKPPQSITFCKVRSWILIQSAPEILSIVRKSLCCVTVAFFWTTHLDHFVALFFVYNIHKYTIKQWYQLQPYIVFEFYVWTTVHMHICRGIIIDGITNPCLSLSMVHILEGHSEHFAYA